MFISSWLTWGAWWAPGFANRWAFCAHTVCAKLTGVWKSCDENQAEIGAACVVSNLPRFGVRYSLHSPTWPIKSFFS